MQWNGEPADGQQGQQQQHGGSTAGVGQQQQQFQLPGPEAFPFGLEFGPEDAQLALLESFPGGDPGG